MKNLHKQFVQLGRQRNQLTYKLLALLPEINEKKIFLKHGCNTIVEYAGKFGGLSREVVKKTLKVHKDVEDKPHLKAAIEKVGIHKVGIISGAATKENEKVLAETVQNAPTKSVQMLSKEIRNNGCQKENYGEFMQSIFDKNNNVSVQYCQAAPVKMSIELDDEMQFQFLKLKKKFGENLSNREALRKMLSELGENHQQGQDIRKYKWNTKQQKQENVTNFCAEIRDKKTKSLQSHNCNKEIKSEAAKKTTSRYIPVHLKRAALEETDGKCSYPGCNKPAELFHHILRFAENKNHLLFRPMCKCHHDYAHNGLIINEHKDPKYWQLAIPWTKSKTVKPQKGYADTFYLLHKQGAL